MADLPPELDMAAFESIMDEVDVRDLDVVDEVGDSDEEKGKGRERKRSERDRDRDHDRDRKGSSTRSIRSRERSHSIRKRSRSPRRIGRTRSRSRSRSRDRIRRRSPPRRSPVRTTRGATMFLNEIKEKFGEFEGLKEVQSKVESHTILKNRSRDRAPLENFTPETRKQMQRHQNNTNNVMPNQMMGNPMAMGPNMMGPMMGPGMPPMGMPYQMPMGPGFNGNFGPPGVDPSMNFDPQIPFMPQQPMMNPEPPVNQQFNQMEYRNASPPPAVQSDIDLGSISSQLLSENRLNLSEYLETQASASRTLTKTIEARPLKERTLMKCKAALTRINNPANNLQFSLNFLHVPPAYPSEAMDAIGASPILPSKHNPVFRFSTKEFDVIQKCHPYPAVTHNIYPLITQLGIDESVIARRLETTSRDRSEHPAVTSHPTNSRNPTATPNILQSRPEMKDMSCQTPVLACAKCDKRLSNLVNTQTQTAYVEKYSTSTQTVENEFTVAKLRLKMWEKECQQKVQSFRREYDDNYSDEEEEKVNIKQPRVAPPGFREMQDMRASSNNSSKNSGVSEHIKGYYDRYFRR